MTGSDSSALNSSVAAATSPLMLRVRGGSLDGRLIRLSATNCLLGSAANCTLRLRASGVHDVHCRIVRSASGTTIERLDPQTWLNGMEFERAELQPGDLLRVGPLEFEVEEDLAALDSSRADATHREPVRIGSAVGNQTQPVAARSELETDFFRRCDERLAQLQELEQAIGQQEEHLRGDLVSIQSDWNARNAELDRRLNALQTAQSEFAQQQETWKSQYLAIHEQLQERANRIDAQLARLDSEWQSFENYVLHRRCEEQHLASERNEQIDNRLAELRAERESLEHERKHPNDRSHGASDPGKQIDQRLAELQTERKARERERQLHSMDRGSRCVPQPAPSEVDNSPADSSEPPHATAPADSADPPTHEFAEQRSLQADSSEGSLADGSGSSQMPADAATTERQEGVTDDSSAYLTPVSPSELDAASIVRSIFQRESAPATDKQESFTVIRDEACIFPRGSNEDGDAVPRQPDETSLSPDTENPRAESARTARPVEIKPELTNQAAEEESIEQYMARLMDRVRGLAGRSSEPTPTDTPQESITESAHSAAQAVATQEPPKRAEVKPRVAPPELISNMSAMRDLANLSARAAIHSHSKRTMSREARSKLIVAIVGLIGAFTLAWYSFEGHWATFIAAVGSTAVALVWGLRYLHLTSQPDPPSSAR